MKLYQVKDSKLQQVSPASFKLEKDIQSLVENNLQELFGLELVRSEFTVRNFRIDTLGYDKDNKTFVVIEYKKDRNFSVIDQGYTYMSLMLNNKSDFIVEYNESRSGYLKRDDIDWSQSRVIFVSPHFTEYQKHSVNFKDVPFELWEIKKYDNGQVCFIPHKPTSKESIATIASDSESVVEKVSREIKVYSEDFHLTKLKSITEETKELYEHLKERILELDNVEIVPRKDYIAFSRERNFVDISIQSKNLMMWLNMKQGELDDPKGETRDVKEIGHHGNGDYELKVYPDTDLDYVMFLIKQSYKKQADNA